MWNCLNAFLPPEEMFEYPLHFPHLPILPSRVNLEAESKPKPMVPWEIKKFRELSKNKSQLPVDEAAFFVRTLGEAPSQADIAEFQRAYGPTVDCDATLAWKTKLHNRTHDQVAQFKKGTGQLSKNQMYTLLTSFGEGLTQQEATAILEYEEIQTTTGQIDYEKFCTL